MKFYMTWYWIFTDLLPGVLFWQESVVSCLFILFRVVTNPPPYPGPEWRPQRWSTTSNRPNSPVENFHRLLHHILNAQSKFLFDSSSPISLKSYNVTKTLQKTEYRLFCRYWFSKRPVNVPLKSSVWKRVAQTNKFLLCRVFLYDKCICWKVCNLHF